MAVWKKALCFGGAVLLLSACDQSVTAPTGLSRVESNAAAKTSSCTTKKTMGTTTTTSFGPDCSSVVIRTGEDTTCVPTDGQ